MLLKQTVYFSVTYLTLRAFFRDIATKATFFAISRRDNFYRFMGIILNANKGKTLGWDVRFEILCGFKLFHGFRGSVIETDEKAFQIILPNSYVFVFPFNL